MQKINRVLSPVRHKKEIWKKISFDEKFELCHHIGRGSYGIVYKIKDKHTNINYAIKIFINHAESNQDADDEVSNMKHIKKCNECYDCNIIELVDFFVNDKNESCIITKLYHGTLYQYISLKKTQKMNYNHYFTAKVIYELAKSLNFLHTKAKLIHTDLKPENIFVELDGDVPKIILADLGSCVKLKKFRDTNVTTRTYRAPEIENDEIWDEKIDIWSLGCIAFELFTGIPLIADTPQINYNNLHKIINNYILLRQNLTDDDNNLNNLIIKMLDLNKSTRLSARDIIYDEYIIKYALI
jgi:serine/threonine protein kinase